MHSPSQSKVSVAILTHHALLTRQSISTGLKVRVSSQCAVGWESVTVTEVAAKLGVPACAIVFGGVHAPSQRHRHETAGTGGCRCFGMAIEGVHLPPQASSSAVRTTPSGESASNHFNSRWSDATPRPVLHFRCSWRDVSCCGGVSLLVPIVGVW